jgi:hypothetical protein
VPRDGRRTYPAHGGTGNDGEGWTVAVKKRQISSAAAQMHLAALGSIYPARAGAVRRARHRGRAGAVRRARPGPSWRCPTRAPRAELELSASRAGHRRRAGTRRNSSPYPNPRPTEWDEFSSVVAGRKVPATRRTDRAHHKARPTTGACPAWTLHHDRQRAPGSSRPTCPAPGSLQQDSAFATRHVLMPSGVNSWTVCLGCHVVRDAAMLAPADPTRPFQQ